MTLPPQTGMPEPLAPGLRRLIAPNPSPMTYWGTNTYLLGEKTLAVIDPGPADPQHLAAILAAVPAGARISHILVTHAHLDHSPLARELSQLSGAPVLAFGDAQAGRSPMMQRLATDGMQGGGEGVDADFTPDVTLADGAVVETAEWRLQALHSPGHFCNHLCFMGADYGFSGDHVMGWSSTLISPPDGDLGDYLRSLDRLAARRPDILYPGHGAPITDPAHRIAELAAHRADRHAQIRAALAQGPTTAPALAAALYQEIPPALLGAAARNVFAHLIELVQENAARAEKPLHPLTIFAPV
ncbi:MBL fold metallo-hydrolase [Phaeovulum sp. W22_SRMD_FR3]|uniref:MBL fold metallo-hydrolase n=1 Tax=Phaeovulum sp. W22_SRMD_FR3 TaxID=3240274 RepID=UPI003F9967DE